MIPETLFTFAPLESHRFKLNAYRGVLETIDTDAILAIILQKEIDLLIIRIPAEKQYDLALLNELGMPFIVADTLVYYHADIPPITPKPYRNPDLVFTRFTSAHFAISERIVQDIFAGYRNNYSANPVLEADLVEIYQDWARAYATDQANGKFSWLVGRGTDIFGLITCLVLESELEVILNGVLPREAGKGVYGDMIRFVQRFCMENQLSRIRISTQVSNFAVQKVWSREGFYLKNAFVTIHINSLMKTSRIPKKQFDVRLTEEECAADFVADDVATVRPAFASSAKMEIGKHRLLGLVMTGGDPAFFPKEGTVLVKNTLRHVKPLKTGADYRIEISYPYVNPVNGMYTAMVKAYDHAGDICFFSYLDYINEKISSIMDQDQY